jgi:hypothetical protein
MKLVSLHRAVDCVIRAIPVTSTLIEGELPQGVVLEENRLVGTVTRSSRTFGALRGAELPGGDR